jgi:RNA polymerase sigma-70 factor, ECF subfamily
VRDAREFKLFYAATYRRIVGQLFALTGDLEDAEDVAQEAFLRAATRGNRLRTYDAPEAWVRRVGFNLAVNHRRSLRRRLAALARTPRTPDVPPLGVEQVSLVETLRAIPLRYRQVLVLHYVLDLAVEEVARQLGIPTGTVKARLSRGRAALARRLDGPSSPVEHPLGESRHVQ